MSVFADEERSSDPRLTSMFTDGLGNGQDVGFGKGPVQRASAMAAGAKAHQLSRIFEGWLAIVIAAFKFLQVHQQVGRGRLAGVGIGGHSGLVAVGWSLRIPGANLPASNHSVWKDSAWPPWAQLATTAVQMIRALLLIFNGSRTWETIKNDQHGVGRISVSFLFPLLILTSLGEALGLLRLGLERGELTLRVVKPDPGLVTRYELLQVTGTLLIVYLGAVALQRIGASFHRRHSYKECFTTLAYSISPLLLLRLLDGVPSVPTWLCYGVGAFLMLSLFYRSIPFIMRPDPSNALGLFVFCSFLLLMATGLAHYLATLVLEEKLFAQ